MTTESPATGEDPSLATITSKPESDSRASIEGEQPEMRTQIIDFTRIRDIFGDNNEAIKQFLNLFIQSTDETLAEIDVAMKIKIKMKRRNYLSSLKGSAGKQWRDDYS